MGTIKSFEDLAVWKMARTFSKKVFELTCEGRFAKDFSLRDQLNASTGSVMDNIAEGFERGGNREFINFLSYAKGSIGESRSQLIRAFDRKYIDEKMLEQLKEEAISIGNRIGAFMSYLQRSAYKGSKFHDPTEPYANRSQTPSEGKPGTTNPEC